MYSVIELHPCLGRLSPQDIFNALLLSESVYKVADFGPEAAARVARQLAGELPQVDLLEPSRDPKP